MVRAYKLSEAEREQAKLKMRERRKDNPKYGQPRVNRSTIAYCERCNTDMPWGEAKGRASEGYMLCPKCGEVLKTLGKSRDAGANVRRTTRCYCINCRKSGYWKSATIIDGRLVCSDCGSELYAIHPQPVPGSRGGVMKEQEKEKV